MLHEKLYLTHKDNIHYFGVLLLVVSLAISPFMLSMAEFIIVGNWFINGFVNKHFAVYFEKIKNNLPLKVFLLIYAVQFAGLFYSNDIGFALHNLKIKLPILLLPIVFAGYPALSRQKTQKILLVFIFSIFVSTYICLVHFLFISDDQIENFRKLSFIISHIRYSLYINLAIFSCFHITKSLQQNKYKIVLLGVIFWLITFLFILKSMTGIVIFLCIFIFNLFYHLNKVKNDYLKIILYFAIIFIPVLFAIYITNKVKEFYNVEKPDIQQLDEKTTNGNFYKHNFSSKTIENGYFVGYYLCEKEVEQEWNKLSFIPYHEMDKKNQEIKYTLHRYLTSKGLRKDSVGVSKLTKQDVTNIENGIANYIFADSDIETRIYQIIWEYNEFKNGANPSGHSVFQRIEFLRAAVNIIKEHPTIGTGTGDVKDAFCEMYNKMQTQLLPQFQLRSHNQFVSFAVASGIPGAVICIISMYYPIWYSRKKLSYYFVIFMIIATLSMFNEDTLETQAGVAFYAFFYAFLFFSQKEQQKTISN